MNLEMFAAKSDRLKAEMWLPFNAHAWDAAEIMERLLCQWLPDEGLLQVTDLALFRDVMTNGIGRGKAYGMGLLMVMR